MKQFKRNLNILLRGIKIAWKIEKRYVAICTVLAFLSPVSAYINIHLLSMTINQLAEKKGVDKNLIILVIVLLATNCLMYIINRTLELLKGYNQTLFFQNEQMLFSEKMMEMDLEDVEKSEVFLLRAKIESANHSGYNMHYLISNIQKSLNSSISIILSCLMLISILHNRFAIYREWLSFIACICITLLLRTFCTKKANAVKVDMYQKFAPYNTRARFYADYYDNYGVCKDIKLYNMADILARRQQEESEQSLHIITQASKQGMIYNILDSSIDAIILLASYLFAVNICMFDKRVGDITKLIAVVSQLTSAISVLIMSIQMLNNNSPYLSEYFRFLDIPNLQNNTNFNYTANDPNIAIRVENLSFRYPNSQKQVLQNITLAIPFMKKTAIVGINGSGKSTLIKVLCNLYKQYDGSVYVNGIRYNTDTSISYHRNFGTVFQDSELLAFSVAENVSAGTSLKDSDIISALTKAGFAERLYTMEKGINTILYKDLDATGVELSGGEEQKVMISRAYYQNPDIYIFDEPTAALDPISERDIFEKINLESNNATVIFVSHRLSACKFCDHIIVIDDGKVVQSGTHEQLLKQENKRYAQLWYTQAKLYE